MPKQLVESVVNRDWSKLVRLCNLEHWKEVLATIMTYTDQEEMLELCDQLGTRIETNDGLKSNLLKACICYICSMNIENLVRCWEKLYKGEFENQDCSAELQVCLWLLFNTVTLIITCAPFYNLLESDRESYGSEIQQAECSFKF